LLAEMKAAEARHEEEVCGRLRARLPVVWRVSHYRGWRS
jgi:hypothetical protein